MSLSNKLVHLNALLLAGFGRLVKGVKMPWTAFIANGLWVLVVGLMGPSVPFIIDEFSINYSQAGLIFSFLSIAALFGAFLGGWVSDYQQRKRVWMICILCLSISLVIVGQVSNFAILLFIIFIISFFGSPIGALGQGIMLQMFPEKRRKYLFLCTMFAAFGSLIAPLLVSFTILLGSGWRGAFYVSALIGALLIPAIAFSKMPKPVESNINPLSIFQLFKDSRMIFVGFFMFLCVGVDVGFAYWLAEYFIIHAGIAPELSGFTVGCYLAGIIIGRFLNALGPEKILSRKLPIIGLTAAALSLFLFLNVDPIILKYLFCFLFGIFIGPAFPSLMALGTNFYPDRSGAATAVLFSMMSLSGIVFPLFLGALGSAWGIETAYYSLLIIMIPIIIGAFLRKKFLS